jgi:hypothetical protein
VESEGLVEEESGETSMRVLVLELLAEQEHPVREILVETAL